METLTFERWRETPTARREEFLCLEGRVWSMDTEPTPVFLRCHYDDRGKGNGSVYVQLQDDPTSCALELHAEDVVVLLGFVLEQGLAERLQEEPQAPAPGSTAEEEAAPEGDGPFPLPPLVEGSCQRELVEDKDWLRVMHHGHELSTGDIAKLCGVSYGTIKSRMERFGIEVMSHRGRRSRVA